MRLTAVLVGLALCGGCKRHAAKPTAPPSPSGVLGTGAQPAEAPAPRFAPSEPPPLRILPPEEPQERSSRTSAPARPCRALLNLKEGRVADVRMTPQLSVRYGEANVVHGADGVAYTVYKRRHVARGEWEVLFARGPHGGKPIVLLDTDPQLPEAAGAVPEGAKGPGDDWGDDSPPGFSATHAITVMGIFGDMISLYVERHGYSGGPHGYDDTGFMTVKVPTVTDVRATQLLGEEHLADLRGILKRDATLRVDEPLDNPPRITSLETLSGIAFSLGSERAGAEFESDKAQRVEISGRPDLYIDTMLHCCTWAQNHNALHLTAQLDPIPQALAAYAPNDGALVAPNGCAQLDLEHAEVDIGGRRYPLPDLDDTVGVTWLKPDDPLDVKQLQTLP